GMPPPSKRPALKVIVPLTIGRPLRLSAQPVIVPRSSATSVLGFAGTSLSSGRAGGFASTVGRVAIACIDMTPEYKSGLADLSISNGVGASGQGGARLRQA